MLKVFKPDLMIDSYLEFDAKKFAEMGYKVLLTDLDNTLVPFDVRVINQEVEDFIKKNKAQGIETIIFSNNNADRVNSFVGNCTVPHYARALKPLKTISLSAFFATHGITETVNIFSGFTSIFSAK